VVLAVVAAVLHVDAEDNLYSTVYKVAPMAAFQLRLAVLVVTLAETKPAGAVPEPTRQEAFVTLSLIRIPGSGPNPFMKFIP
jgi:hypothetical protein